MQLLTYPARPVNGGPLDRALPKTGEWLYEPKYNGWRALVHAPTGTMFNRQGERLSIASEFYPALEEARKFAAGLRPYHRLTCTDLHGRTQLTAAESEWLDCEALSRRHTRGRGTLVVLDLPMLKLPAIQRGYVLRESFCPAIDHCASKDSLYSVPQWTDGPAVYSELKLNNRDLGIEFYEGVVAKRADSLYPIQLRSPSLEFPFWMKHRWAF